MCAGTKEEHFDAGTMKPESHGDFLVRLVFDMRSPQ